MINFFKLNKFIVSFFGIGFIKGGGTVSSILIFFICILFLKKILMLKVIFLFMVLLILSIILINFELKNTLKKDPSYIVLDEIIGYLFGFILLKYFCIQNFDFYFLILFRFFDIYKPFFILKVEKLNGYMGVILDDVLAALYSLILIFILK
jgi:phosphatidylglycerophosphatase A